MHYQRCNSKLYLHWWDKADQAPSRALARCSSPWLGQWARRCVNHLRLGCMAGAMPDLWLPSQSQGITALRPVPVPLTEVRVCEQLACKKLNPRPRSRKSNALTIRPPGHRRDECNSECMFYETTLAPSVYEKHMESCVCSAEWWCCRWPQVTPVTQNYPCSDVLHLPSYLWNGWI